MSLQMLIVYGISHFFLAVFMMVFIKKRYNPRTTAAILAVTYLLVFMLEFLRYRLFQMGVTWRFNMVIATFVSLAGVAAVSQYRDGRVVFTAFLGGSYTMFGSMAAKILIYAHVTPMAVFAAEIACHVLLLFLLIRFLLPPYRKLQQVYRAEWGQFTLMMVMFYSGTYLLFDCLKRPDATILHYMIPPAYLFTIYLLVVLMCQMLERLNAKELEDRQQRVLEACMGALKVEVEELRRAERRIVEYNHDSRHFVHMLRGMMADQDYPGVIKALAAMGDMPHMPCINQYCLNMPINGVITYYDRMASDRQIRMEVELESLPEDLGANEWEIAMVLGNILEILVGAGMPVEPSENRRMRMEGRRIGEQIWFEIRSIVPDKGKMDKYTHFPVQEDADGPGLGMRSLAGLVERWNGTMECGTDGEWFYVKILI